MKGRKIQIVAIDDEPAFAEMLGIYLHEFGDFQIHTYTDPDEAIDHIISGNVEAVISDYLMEDIDGISLIRQIKSKFPDIPCVLLTAMDDKDVIFEATNAGVDFIQFKSESPERLFSDIAQKITNAVAIHRARRALLKESKIREIMMRSQRDLMGKLSVCSTQNEAMDACLTTIRYLIECTIGSIHLINRRTKKVELAISHNLSNEELKKFSHGDIHQVIYTRKPLYFPAENAETGPVEKITGGQIPISSGGEVIGALTFVLETPRVIIQEIRDTIEIMTSQLGNTLIRIQSEEQVRQRQEELSELYAVMEELVIVIDMDGTIINVNPTTSRVLGYQEEEMIGMPIQALYPADIRDEIIFQFLNLTGSGSKIQNTYPFVDRDGTLIQVETRGTVGIWGGRNVLFSISRDISERIKAEKILHESYERIKGILATSPAHIYMKDINLHYILANQPFCEFVRTDPETIPGKTDADLFPEAIASRRNESDIGVVKTDNPEYNLVEEIFGPDGNSVWLVSSKVPTHDQSGAVTGVVGTSVDITDLIRARKELEKRDRVLSAVSTVAEGLVRGDEWEPVIPECLELLGRAIKCEMAFLATFSKNDNECCSLLYQWQEPELTIAVKPEEIIPRIITNETIGFLQKVPFYQINKAMLDSIITAEEGAAIPQHILCLPVFSYNKLWGILGFISCIDNSGTTLAEVESLSMASELIGSAISRYYTEELFRKPVERSLVGIYLIQDDRFVYLNPRMSEIVGYPREEMEHNTYISYIHPDDLELVEDKHNTVLQAPDLTDDYEFRIIHADGRVVIVENLISGFSYQGRPAVIGSVMDVTTRKQAEDSLRNSLHEKDILLREVHHRVKNNMQIIISMLRIQTSLTEDPDVIEILRESKNRILSMAIIHEKLYRTDNLISINLLEYISSLTNSMVADFSPDESQITLNLVCDPSIEMTIDAGIPLGLIMNELLTNSFKHGFSYGETGTISISIFSTEAGYIEIEYKDSGKGLPPDFDIEACESLGMQIISNLIFQASGEIQMYSEDGTVVRIKIPMSEGFIVRGDEEDATGE